MVFDFSLGEVVFGKNKHMCSTFLVDWTDNSWHCYWTIFSLYIQKDSCFFEVYQ